MLSLYHQKTSHGREVFMLDGDFCSTFEASALEYIAASLSRDTRPKAMRLCAMASVRLVRSFWHIYTMVSLFILFLKWCVRFCKNYGLVIQTFTQNLLIYPHSLQMILLIVENRHLCFTDFYNHVLSLVENCQMDYSGSNSLSGVQSELRAYMAGSPW